ncbi:hypothetical protein [Fibrobacter sp.]|uniref:hypothetical protein n=1 Tax=Fibrobacter sp. TaxID=35828 RepID=UPI0025BA9D71|nr:hypothetical protein [Fibrobacter sp.]MBR3072181.1 hypothetical protein [Fibrobacter sp.]
MKTRWKRMSGYLDTKTEAAKFAFERAKACYENASAKLRELMDRRKENHKRELIEAIGKSNRTYDKILNFIRG